MILRLNCLHGIATVGFVLISFSATAMNAELLLLCDAFQDTLQRKDHP